jgi:hypothetical protein
MTTVKKSKIKPTLESFIFATPEQKLLRFLLGECTNSFTPRVLSSRLKGVRGLGGADGITKVLKLLEELGFVQFVDNNRSVRVCNDNLTVERLKVLCSVCDLEGLAPIVDPISTKGVLFGSRSSGKFRADSYYDLFVVSESADEVRRIVESFPLGRRIELTVWPQDDYYHIEKKDPELAARLASGFVLWGPEW